MTPRKLYGIVGAAHAVLLLSGCDALLDLNSYGVSVPDAGTDTTTQNIAPDDENSSDGGVIIPPRPEPTSFCPEGPRPRDCASSSDNDCDGEADDTLDDVCRCAPGSKEVCNAHADKDGRGPCRAGERVCEVDAAGTSSDWGLCTGDVAPEDQDDCAVPGDDSDCDGVPNGPPCACNVAPTQSCGPATENGICQFGVSTCVDNEYGACEGAVAPRARDCRSSEDNDCDGFPDDTVDGVCACTIGDTRACDTHSQDNVGICRAGIQTCIAGADNTTSRFGTCTGAVAPAARNCASSADNDCDGAPDNAANGSACLAPGAVGVCASGTFTCRNGALTCTPQLPARELCDNLDNDCDGQPDEANTCTLVTAVEAEITTGRDDLSDTERGRLFVLFNYVIEDFQDDFDFRDAEVSGPVARGTETILRATMPSGVRFGDLDRVDVSLRIGTSWDLDVLRVRALFANGAEQELFTAVGSPFITLVSPLRAGLNLHLGVNGVDVQGACEPDCPSAD